MGLAAAIITVNNDTEWISAGAGAGAEMPFHLSWIPKGLTNAGLIYRLSASQMCVEPTTFSFRELLQATRNFRCKDDRLAMTLTCGLGSSAHPVDHVASHRRNFSNALLSSRVSWGVLGWLLSLVALDHKNKSHTPTDGTAMVGMTTTSITNDDAPATEMKRLLENRGDGAQYLRAVECGIPRRTFFRTKSGMVGVGPEGMRKGDLLCAFFGAGVPFALRPQENGEHLLVGDCYAYDIMHGELLNGLVQGHQEGDGPKEVWWVVV